MIKKNFDKPDEVMGASDRMKVDKVEAGGLTFYRATVQPGWKWTEDIGPHVKTPTCQDDHVLYMVSGSMHVKMDDGQEMDYGPGDVVHIPPGHDGWQTGDEAAVWIQINR